jgi:hypothetical protein
VIAKLAASTEPLEEISILSGFDDNSSLVSKSSLYIKDGNNVYGKDVYRDIENHVSKEGLGLGLKRRNSMSGRRNSMESLMSTDSATIDSYDKEERKRVDLKNLEEKRKKVKNFVLKKTEITYGQGRLTSSYSNSLPLDDPWEYVTG